MIDVITYSLRMEDDTSDEYYKKVSEFTDEVINKFNEVNSLVVKEFQDYIIKKHCEPLREKNEYALEILTLGILWNLYIGNAVVLKQVPKRLLCKLMFLRGKNENLKAIIDKFRGILGTVFLLKDNNESLNVIKRTAVNMNKLIEWLSASGDFNEEAKRLKNWQNYLSNKTREEQYNIITIAVDLAKWFEDKSEQAIGEFTKNVEVFLNEIYSKRGMREDVIYCGRKRVEYHLNMVGAEIMNRTFRKAFLKTKEKILFLPACMRFQSENNCKAIKTEEGYLCSNCTSTCKVNKLSKMCVKYNCKVFTIPHESLVSTKEKIKKDEIGIIGVACTLNLIAGGWKAKDMGFVPQCVLLDYCGCKNHWYEKEIITDINMCHLRNILK